VVDARDYVVHYAGEKPGNVTKAVMQSLSDIEKVVTLIQSMLLNHLSDVEVNQSE
jgi:hypothetical protein